MTDSARTTLPQHLLALGFTRNPFPQTPDADCYFRTEAIEQQFAETLHCLKAAKGFVLVTGEVGTGKSTFLRCLLDDLVKADCAVSFVFNTFLQGRDLLLAINRDLGLLGGKDMAEDIEHLNHHLIKQHEEGRVCVVVIDDAQNLDISSLELLRLLSNLETRQNKLLQIVLSGQPELLDLLRQKESRQLASRIVQHVELSVLSPNECERYVNFRITRSGTNSRIQLSASAQRALHRHSKGNPRRLHLIMDRCLYGVAADKQPEIGRPLIVLAASESGIAQPRQSSQLRWWGIGGVAFAVSLFAAASSRLLTPDSPLQKVVAAPQQTVLVDEQKKVDRDCLHKLLPELADGNLDISDIMQNAGPTRQSLAKAGWVIAEIPPGIKLAAFELAPDAKVCRWDFSRKAWLIWQSPLLPFELQEGSKGEAIKWLQTRLAEKHFYSAKVDAYSGWQTQAALHVFQQRHGLPVQELVDAWTLFVLEFEQPRSIG
jgi:general secretion pathway protein A